MGTLTSSTSNTVIWISYSVLLVGASLIALWKRDHRSTLSCNGSRTAFPLAINFIASGLGCGMLTTFPQIANVAGLQGLLVYTLTGALPLFAFSFLGPLIRKKTPKGFVLTEWVYARFGKTTGLYLSICTIFTLFLFMVSEVSALKYAIETLTTCQALPVVVIQCIVTTVYTSIGGSKISFITDNIQVSLMMVLVVTVACAMGSYTPIDTTKIISSGLLSSNKLGWQLIYILTVAIITNDFFSAGFWMRAFASKSDSDLRWACTIAFFALSTISFTIGVTGFISVWAGFLDVSDINSSAAFYIILSQMPTWVTVVVTMFVTWLSTCTMDSLQSAMVSTISNDLFRNQLPLLYIRTMVVVIMIPVIIVGVMAMDVFQIYLIVDILASAVVPILMLGLSSKFDMLSACEVIGGGIGGLFSVFLFGTIYHGSVSEGFRLLLMWDGLYNDDWSAFGAFVAAPFGGLLCGFAILFIRAVVHYVACLKTNSEFNLLSEAFVYNNCEMEQLVTDEESYSSTDPRKSSLA